MHPIFNAYKRHYHRAKDTYRALRKTGDFGFEYKYVRDEGITAKVETPDEALTLQFIILMRKLP